jgi:hypothetical protein
MSSHGLVVSSGRVISSCFSKFKDGIVVSITLTCVILGQLPTVKSFDEGSDRAVRGKNIEHEKLLQLQVHEGSMLLELLL